MRKKGTYGCSVHTFDDLVLGGSQGHVGNSVEGIEGRGDDSLL